MLRRRHTFALSELFLGKWDCRTKCPTDRVGRPRNRCIDPFYRKYPPHRGRIRCPDRRPSKWGRMFHRRPRPFCQLNTLGITWCTPCCNKRRRCRTRIGSRSRLRISLHCRASPYTCHRYTKSRSRNQRSSCTSYCRRHWHSCTASSSSERRCLCTFRRHRTFWVARTNRCTLLRSWFRLHKVYRPQRHCNFRSSRTRGHLDQSIRYRDRYP